MTRLARIMAERKATYASVAERAHVQPRTIRQLATGETPLDNATVGTIRRVAAALSLPVADLLEPELAFPGDASVPRGERLTRAIREVMWSGETPPYPSPVEDDAPDEIATGTADEFFADMLSIDARRG